MLSDRVHPHRWRLAALAGAVGAMAMLAVGDVSSASARAPGDELLPDLRTQPHDVLYVAGDELRLSNTIANTGTGALEIYPEPDAGNDCDRDGDEENDRRAYQRVFQDSSNPGSPGYFIRGQDTAWASQQVGCMVYHPLHQHWHFEKFSVYVLRTEPTWLIARRSVKISFCVIDTDHPFPGLAGSPFWYYGGAGCGPTSVEGLSIGWADTYSAQTQGQSLDIAGLPAGNYCLVSRADPVDRLEETNDLNNARRTRLFLDPAAGTVTRLTGPCLTAPG